MQVEGFWKLAVEALNGHLRSNSRGFRLSAVVRMPRNRSGHYPRKMDCVLIQTPGRLGHNAKQGNDLQNALVTPLGCDLRWFRELSEITGLACGTPGTLASTRNRLQHVGRDARQDHVRVHCWTRRDQAQWPARPHLPGQLAVQSRCR